MSEHSMKDLNMYKKEYENVNMSNEAYRKMVARMEQAKKEKRAMENRTSYKGFVAAAAAAIIMILPNVSATAAYAMGNMPVLGGFFKVITVREYNYEDEYKQASIEEVEISADAESMEGEAYDNAKKSVEEINAQIKDITEKWEAEFKASLESEGYKNVTLTSEVVSTSDYYFTLKLTGYEAAASGYEVSYYYTLDLRTGERVELEDLFKSGSDYKAVIGQDIERQMEEQSKADENRRFWLNDELMTDWSIEKAMENAFFYINTGNELVMVFNEGEVAPMYMGTVEFVIPDSVIADIRK